MKTKLAIVFMLFFALSVGAVSAADEDGTTDETPQVSIDPAMDEVILEATDEDVADDGILVPLDTEDENILISPAPASNQTNTTIPMQTTGTQIIPIALATLIAAGGVIAAKVRG